MSPLIPGFKSHPPHHLRNVEIAHFSLILSVEQRKIDFKMRVALDFTWAFKTVKLTISKSKCWHFRICNYNPALLGITYVPYCFYSICCFHRLSNHFHYQHPQIGWKLGASTYNNSCYHYGIAYLAEAPPAWKTPMIKHSLIFATEIIICNICDSLVFIKCSQHHLTVLNNSINVPLTIQFRT